MLAEPTTKKRVSLQPTWGFVPAGSDQGLKRLVRATILQAAYDARKDDHTGGEARRWLSSDDCAFFCDFGGVNFRAIQEWVMSGCPDWRKVKEEK